NATVDEGNNWVNIQWGPLTMTNPISGVMLGNYAPAAGSPALNYIPTSASGGAPSTDFFGNPRPDPATPYAFDIGAIELTGAAGAPPTPTLSAISPNKGVRGSAVQVTLTGTNLAGVTSVTVPGGGVTVSGLTNVSANTATATFTIAGGTTATTTARQVTVTSPTGISNSQVFTVTGPTLNSITPSSGARGSTVAVTITGTNLTR